MNMQNKPFLKKDLEKKKKKEKEKEKNYYDTST